jgi:uncharacterized protein
VAEPRPLCPTCGKPFPEGPRVHGSFCSERCQMVDLGRWLNGAYSIPATGTPGDEPDLD